MKIESGFERLDGGSSGSALESPLVDPGPLESRGFSPRSVWRAQQPPLPKRRDTERRRPAPPPLGDSDDQVRVSLSAAYLMVGDRFDPEYITPNELAEMTEIMIAGQAITRGDQAMLLDGPNGRGYPLHQAGQARNIIEEWQHLLARAVGASNLFGVSRATRALGILGRVAVTRLPS